MKSKKELNLVKRYGTTIVSLFVLVILLLGINVGVGLKLLLTNSFTNGIKNISLNDYLRVKYNFSYKVKEIDCKDDKISIDIIMNDQNSKINYLCIDEDTPSELKIDLAKKLTCNYIYQNKKWYIKKSDVEICARDYAINEIEYILQNIELYHKNKTYIKNSWK